MHLFRSNFLIKKMIKVAERTKIMVIVVDERTFYARVGGSSSGNDIIVNNALMPSLP